MWGGGAVFTSVFYLVIYNSYIVFGRSNFLGHLFWKVFFFICISLCRVLMLWSFRIVHSKFKGTAK